MPKSPLSSPQSSPESKSKLSESKRKIVASEEDREAGERSIAQSPALPALCASPPSSIELLPVLVDPVQGEKAPSCLGRMPSSSAGQKRPRIVAQLEGIHARSLLCRNS